MISCLCVTRGDRPALLANAVGDFARQDHAERELLILHDGDDAAAGAIAAIVARTPGAHRVRIERVAPGRPLGALRTLAMARAGGDWVCQWDDDDRYHPQRLSLQWSLAMRERAGAVFLVDQLHHFVATRTLSWDDWSREPYPMNLIQGSVLARRDLMPPYPDLPRGEDTLQTHALLRRAATTGTRIARLCGKGWCYIYTFHGGNVWDGAHHEAIARAKHLQPAILLPRLDALRQRLGEYAPAPGPVTIRLGAEAVAVA